jgi:hypothetical protein
MIDFLAPQHPADPHFVALDPTRAASVSYAQINSSTIALPAYFDSVTSDQTARWHFTRLLIAGLSGEVCELGYRLCASCRTLRLGVLMQGCVRVNALFTYVRDHINVMAAGGPAQLPVLLTRTLDDFPITKVLVATPPAGAGPDVRREAAAQLLKQFEAANHLLEFLTM